MSAGYTWRYIAGAGLDYSLYRNDEHVGILSAYSTDRQSHNRHCWQFNVWSSATVLGAGHNWRRMPGHKTIDEAKQFVEAAHTMECI